MSFAEVTLELLKGFAVTCQLFILTLVLALPLGLIIAFGSMSRFLPLKYVTKAFVWVIRGTPLMLQVIAVFPGSLGVDRFYLGEKWMGFLKYITLGGVGIWWILDIMSAKSRCRAYNCRKILELAGMLKIKSSG